MESNTCAHVRLLGTDFETGPTRLEKDMAHTLDTFIPLTTCTHVSLLSTFFKTGQTRVLGSVGLGWSSARSSFLTDYLKPIPVAAVPLDRKWRQRQSRSSIGARDQQEMTKNLATFLDRKQLSSLTRAYLTLHHVQILGTVQKSRCVNTSGRRNNTNCTWLQEPNTRRR